MIGINIDIKSWNIKRNPSRLNDEHQDISKNKLDSCLNELIYLIADDFIFSLIKPNLILENIESKNIIIY